jgi:hypothetical protein
MSSRRKVVTTPSLDPAMLLTWKGEGKVLKET